MNIKQLEHLLALAQTGSFVRAADRLFITQSALSRSIQGLEDELGGKLVDRIGKRNELTPLGHDVVARARSIIHEAAELRRSAELMQQGGGGSIRVGFGSGPGVLLTTALLCLAAEHHPRVRVSVTRGPTEYQLMKLRARELDALVVDARRVSPAADLFIEPLTDLRAGFLTRADHPLARRQRVTVDDILAYPVASTPLSDEVARHMVAQYGPRANPAEMASLQCEDIENLIATVERTQAVFLGIIAAARDSLAAGRLVVLDLDPPLKTPARFVHVTLAGRTEAPVMALFRRFVAEQLRD